MIVKPVAPASGELQDDVFLFPVRIYYEDTDAGGIVYYANYLKFAERARTEFLRALGVRQLDALEESDKCGFVVRHCEVDYKMPAVLDDELVVSCKMTSAAGARAEMHQEIKRGDELLVSIDIKVAYVSLVNKKPKRIPEEIISQIKMS